MEPVLIPKRQTVQQVLGAILGPTPLTYWRSVERERDAGGMAGFIVNRGGDPSDRFGPNDLLARAVYDSGRNLSTGFRSIVLNKASAFTPELNAR